MTPFEPTATFAVKVVPGASRDAIAGWLGDALKVRVSAPPEKGKANASVEKLIARTLGLPAKTVCISAGQTSAHKRVAITGMTQAAVKAKLDEHCA